MRISEPGEYALLGLLTEGPGHGYDLHQRFAPATDLGRICHVEQNQLYAYLKKLEQLGYITAEVEPQGARPPRRVYHLTPRGHDVFWDWVRAPVARPREVRLQFLLKLYFARRFGPDVTTALINAQIDACNAYLRRFTAEAEALAPGATEATPATPMRSASFEWVIVRARLRQLEATIAWLEEIHAAAPSLTLPAPAKSLHSEDKVRLPRFPQEER
jgi:PadR family transcriptional regulator AphA